MATPPQDPFTRWLTSRGEDPDPRFTLANERTFLAWIRTALGLMGAGVALEVFSVDVGGSGWRRALAVVLVVSGAVTAIGAAVRWVRVERAMRETRTLPAPSLVPVLSLLLVVAGVLVVLAFFSIGG
jgi:putative membrane protein